MLFYHLHAKATNFVIIFLGFEFVSTQFVNTINLAIRKHVICLNRQEKRTAAAFIYIALIRTLFVRYLVRLIYLVSLSECAHLCLAFELAGVHLTLEETPKTYFLVTRPIWEQMKTI